MQLIARDSAFRSVYNASTCEPEGCGLRQPLRSSCRHRNRNQHRRPMNIRATRNTVFALLMAVSLSACKSPSSGPVMKHKIGLVYFAPEEGADMCMKGLFDGLKEQGIEERVNLEVRRAHAQAEIANIPLLIQNYDGSDVDVIVAMTTPVLAAAAGLARSKPVVFTYVYDQLRLVLAKVVGIICRALPVCIPSRRSRTR